MTDGRSKAQHIEIRRPLKFADKVKCFCQSRKSVVTLEFPLSFSQSDKPNNSQA